jgi:hypothetical protein
VAVMADQVPYLTDAEIVDLRRILAEASPLPWHRCEPCDRREAGCTWVFAGECIAVEAYRNHNPDTDPAASDLECGEQQKHRNVRLAAAAVNALPRLLDELEQRRMRDG